MVRSLPAYTDRSSVGERALPRVQPSAASLSYIGLLFRQREGSSGLGTPLMPASPAEDSEPNDAGSGCAPNGYSTQHEDAVGVPDELVPGDPRSIVRQCQRGRLTPAVPEVIIGVRVLG